MHVAFLDGSKTFDRVNCYSNLAGIITFNLTLQNLVACTLTPERLIMQKV